MPKLTRILLGVGLALALTIGPAAADHGGPHPTTRTERVYFHCAGESVAGVSLLKVQNSNQTADLYPYPGWDTTPPTGSMSQGSGCGYYDMRHTGNYRSDAYFSGTFTGNLGSAAVEAYAYEVGERDVQYSLPFTLLVDGEEVAAGRVNLPPGDPGALRRFTFTVTDLPFVFEDGDGVQERTIELRLRNDFQGLWWAEVMWLFDATDVPAGITFNPAEPEGPVVSASPAGTQVAQ